MHTQDFVACHSAKLPPYPTAELGELKAGTFFIHIRHVDGEIHEQTLRRVFSDRLLKNPKGHIFSQDMETGEVGWDLGETGVIPVKVEPIRWSVPPGWGEEKTPA